MESKKPNSGSPPASFRKFNAICAAEMPDDLWKAHCLILRAMGEGEPGWVATIEELISEGEAIRADLPFKWSIDKPGGPAQWRSFSRN
jgi:hypothetical protein